MFEFAPVKRWLALALLFAFGCSNDPDALYARDSRAKDSGVDRHTDVAKPEALPALPALPDADRIPDCTRCAADTCKEARASCLEDDDCTDELRCKGHCDNLACLQTCGADFGQSPWYVDYANCVFGQCPSECNTGNNWQCQGNYDWPAAERSSFDVRFSFTAPPTYFRGSQAPDNVVGATVRACPDNADCEASAQDSDSVGIDNTVTLELHASAYLPKDFRGYIEIDGSDTGDHVRLYPAPLSRAQDYFAGFLPTGLGPDGWNSKRARIDVAVLDCLAAPVTGVHVTLPDFADIHAFAFVNSLSFVAGPTSGTGIATFVDLPEDAASNKVRVHAHWPNPKQTDSERAVWVRPGFSTSLLLAPLARSDQTSSD